MSNLPSDKTARKNLPVGTGVVDYFPDALAEIARVSKIGNDQHNPGQPLHWDRSKSTDEADALMRHFIERGTLDNDGARHSAKMAWRALALLQKEIEKDLHDNQTKILQPALYEPAYGCLIGYNSQVESPFDAAAAQRTVINNINDYIRAGYETKAFYNKKTNATWVEVYDPTDYNNGRGFVVRGKLQRKENSQRGDIQPGSDDCSQQDTPVQHPAPCDEPIYGEINCG